jgi:NADH-quinone oxidoreductase subunit M
MRLLDLLWLAPLLGAVSVGLAGKRGFMAKSLSFVASLATFGAGLHLWYVFDPSVTEYQRVESLAWIPSLGANYLLGVDGISLFMVLLTSFMTGFVVITSQVHERPRAFYVTLLGLEAALLGLFMAIDVLLFYVFWLVALVCLAFLIGGWGPEAGARSAKRFLVVTAGGSLLVLAVILFCHHLYDVQTGAPSFDLRHWEGLVLTPRVETGLFWTLAVAFAVTIPFFPFHGWFLDFIERAPMAAGVLLGAVSVKVGIYGLWRFAFPWFPRAAHAHVGAFSVLALVSLVFAAGSALFERDSKRFLARVSIATLGLVVYGMVLPEDSSVKGAWFALIAHGLSFGAFLLWVDVHRSRAETVSFSGAVNAVLLVMLSLMILGFPGFGGWSGMIPVVQSGLRSAPLQTVFALLGVVLLALGLIRFCVRLIRQHEKVGRSFGVRTLLAVLLPLILLVWLDLARGSFLRPLEAAAESFVSIVRSSSEVEEP